MSTDTGTTLRLSRVIKASREKVFEAWTQPEHMKKWSCPEGMNVGDAQVDLTVGGRYLIRMESPEGKVHTAVGIYREIEKPSRLVYTWDWQEESIGETIVTVEFNEVGESTEVMLSHELFPNGEAKVGHEEGWTSCLNRLERLFV
jgi:uncharacterized protein YndB with AHSA1/START domain